MEHLCAKSYELQFLAYGKFWESAEEQFAEVTVTWHMVVGLTNHRADHLIEAADSFFHLFKTSCKS